MRRRSFLLAGRAGLVALVGGAAALAVAGCNPVAGSGSGAQAGQAGGKMAVIELEKGGSFTIQLFPESAPQTVKNFEDKAKKGFYEGLTFHRVEDWVVQGGDPRGDGQGGGQMPTELSERPFTAGSVGVARRSDIRVSNDSQFFIVKTPPPPPMQRWTQLDNQYTNFGHVVSGMEAVQTIARGDKIKRISVKG